MSYHSHPPSMGSRSFSSSSSGSTEPSTPTGSSYSSYSTSSYVSPYASLEIPSSIPEAAFACSSCDICTQRTEIRRQRELELVAHPEYIIDEGFAEKWSPPPGPCLNCRGSYEYLKTQREKDVEEAKKWLVDNPEFTLGVRKPR